MVACVECLPKFLSCGNDEKVVLKHRTPLCLVNLQSASLGELLALLDCSWSSQPSASICRHDLMISGLQLLVWTCTDDEIKRTYIWWCSSCVGSILWSELSLLFNKLDMDSMEAEGQLAQWGKLLAGQGACWWRPLTGREGSLQGVQFGLV